MAADASGDPGAFRAPRALRLNLVWLGVALAVTALYYALPLGRRSVTGTGAALGFVAGLALLVWAIAWQVRGVRTLGGHVGALLAVLYLAVLFFAATYYVMERTWPEQFANVATRTDALYFAVTVVATVGFGDVHAVGQAARALVTVQMVFNIVVIGYAATMVRSASSGART